MAREQGWMWQQRDKVAMPCRLHLWRTGDVRMMWRCKDRGWDEMAPCLVEEVLVCEAQYEVHLPPSASQPRNPPYLFIKNKIEKKSQAILEPHRLIRKSVPMTFIGLSQPTPPILSFLVKSIISRTIGRQNHEHEQNTQCLCTLNHGC